MKARTSTIWKHWICQAWIGMALLVAVGKCSSPVVREKCLSHKKLAAHSCSATNPGTAATSGIQPETTQLSCHCSPAACGNYSVENVLTTCRSGFVHANKCGACIRCAKDLDEACGGYADHVGNCRAGLLCQIAESDGNEGEGKCVVDKPEQRHPGFIYRNPKATFAIADLSKACQASGKNNNEAAPEKEEEAEVGKGEVKAGTKQLRSLATSSKKTDKMSSVEKGWKEIFEDEENEHPVKTASEPQLEQIVLPATIQTQSDTEMTLPIQNHLYQMPMLPSQPPSRGASDLEVGKMVKSFDSFSDARRYMQSKGLDYDSVSGTVVKQIRNLEKGTAVNNPEEKLKTLQNLPEIKNGRIIAGIPDNFPTINRLNRQKRSVQEQEGEQLIEPESSLLLGRAISVYKTLEEAKQNMDPNILAKVEQVSGREISRDISAAFAVQNPVKVLRDLGKLPDIVNGKIMAGPPSKLTLISRLTDNFN